MSSIPIYWQSIICTSCDFPQYMQSKKQEHTVDAGVVFIGWLKEEGGEAIVLGWGGGTAEGVFWFAFIWLAKGELFTWLAAGAVAMLFGGAGGAGGAAGGGGKEQVAMGGEGLGALLAAVGVWFRFRLIFCAREADDVVVLPPNPDLGATAGALAKDWAAEFGAALWLPCRFVLALSSSAQGAGGGRSPISGGGRKERAGLGAVGGAETLGADEYWLGICGWNNIKQKIIMMEKQRKEKQQQQR